MPTKVHCAKCGEYKSFIVKTAEILVYIRGISYIYLELTAYCEKCGEKLDVPEIDNINAKSRMEAYTNAKKAYFHS